MSGQARLFMAGIAAGCLASLVWVDRLLRQSGRYSVEDLGDMSAALRTLNTSPGYAYHPDEVAAAVERQLQTHIANGTPVAELQQAAEAKRHRERSHAHVPGSMMDQGNPPHA